MTRKKYFVGMLAVLALFYLPLISVAIRSTSAFEVLLYAPIVASIEAIQRFDISSWISIRAIS